MSIAEPQSIPHIPGVYIFRNAKGTPIYIGKAANLKKRLSSYWRKNSGQKIHELLSEATSVEWIETGSEVDALLAEAGLIKKHYPKYNIVMRDDKNYFYVVITRDTFPRIFITHQPVSYSSSGARRSRETTNMAYSRLRSNSNFIGPFTSGSALKSTLRILRGIFPYCTCKELHKRPCLNAEIGRCLGFCCRRQNSQHTNILENVGMFNDANKKEYQRNVKNIIAVLRGKRKTLLREFRRTMKHASKAQAFEQAAKLRDQMFGMENILEHARVLQENGIEKNKYAVPWHKIKKTIQTIFGTTRDISRVEGYDISNISGREATGSMVVFVDGKPIKEAYRKFKIKTVHQPNDIAMHREVIRRRFNHGEWPMPDLLLIDGGRPQLNAALQEVRIKNKELRIMVAALAKREEELYIEGRALPVPLRTFPHDTELFFERVRNESHRFAKKYHHKRREMLYRYGFKKETA